MNSYRKFLINNQPLFILAPMDDVTETVFRRVIDSCSPADLYFTEFVNVDGLQSAGRQNLLKKLRYTQEETRLIVQIWGLNPENFRKTADEIASGVFARELNLPQNAKVLGVDLNMGCPAKSEVKMGACSALIKNPDLAKQIIDATKDGLMGRLPLSVKTRVGFSSVDMNWISFLLQQKLDMLTIHGRTRKEMSKVPANWDLIGKARRLRDSMGVDTLIVGNGDVMSREQGETLAKRYKLDGIMIGRGVFHDPFIFSANSAWSEVPKDEKLALFQRHVELFQNTWQEGERKVITLNKFCKIYIQGFDGAKEMREQLMACDTIENLLQTIKSLRVL